VVRLHARAVATWAAVLWAVHPLHTSAVTYIVHRYEIVASLFYVSALLALLRANEPGARRGSWGAAIVAFSLLACWSKETAVTLPVALFLLDAAFISGSVRAAIRKNGALHALATATCATALFAVFQPRAPTSPQAFHQVVLTPVDYARTQLGVVAHYLRLIVWPTGLCSDYFDWPVARSLRDVMPGAAVTLAALAVALFLLVRAPRLGLVLAWFFLVLSPTSSVLPLSGELVAERRLYLPLLSAAALAAIGLVRLGARRPRLAASVGAALVLVLAGATAARNADYRSAVGFYADTVARRPGNARARFGLANVLKEEGRFDLALVELRACMRIEPVFRDAYWNALVAADKLGLRSPWSGDERTDPARAEQGAAAAADQMAIADRQMRGGNRTAALDALRGAVELDPRAADAWARLSMLLAFGPNRSPESGAEAVRAASRSWALKGRTLDPTLGAALGASLAEIGRFDDAVFVAENLAASAAAAGKNDIANEHKRQLERYRRKQRWTP
jgi:tetratricopeptide (TPR) repeat protein